MKQVLAIGDLGDSPGSASSAVTGSSSSSSTPATPPRKAAGPAVWVQQSDGSWAIKWRGNDTWWDLSARYLQAGKRYKELFNYQSPAFHARVPQPISIYTGALVAMPPEAVQRAQLLGEVPGGGSVQPTPGGGGVSPTPGGGGGGGVTPTPGGGGNINPVPGPGGGGTVTPGPGGGGTVTPPGPGGGGSVTPGPGGGGGITPRPNGGGGGPIVLPSGQHAAGDGSLHWWILGGLGVVVVGTIGVVAFHHHSQQRAQLEGHHGGRRA